MWGLTKRDDPSNGIYAIPLVFWLSLSVSEACLPTKLIRKKSINVIDSKTGCQTVLFPRAPCHSKWNVWKEWPEPSRHKESWPPLSVAEIRSPSNKVLLKLPPSDYNDPLPTERSKSPSLLHLSSADRSVCTSQLDRPSRRSSHDGFDRRHVLRPLKCSFHPAHSEYESSNTAKQLWILQQPNWQRRNWLYQHWVNVSVWLCLESLTIEQQHRLVLNSQQAHSFLLRRNRCHR